MREGRARLGAMLFVAVALAGCAASAEAVDMPAPEWRPGYAWSYLDTVDYEVTYVEDGVRGNESETYQRRVVTEVMNTTFDAEGEPLYLLVEQRYEEDDFWGYFTVQRQRDLADVPHDISFASYCQSLDCTTEEEALTAEASEPATYLDFPLTTGKTWSKIECDDEDECIPAAFSARVDGAAMVDTALGPVKAARVTMSWDVVDPAGYRQMVLEQAADQGYEVDQYDFRFTYREVVYYSDAYQAVVRVDAVSREAESASGRAPDGESFQFEYDETTTSTRVIDGARLSPRAERTIAEAAVYLREPLRDPAGAAVSAAGYTISVVPDMVIVNAADGGNVTFEASVDGVDGLPDGHSIDWRIIDASGEAVSEISGGTTLQARFGIPGAYSVEAEARDGEAVVATSGAAVVANWHATQMLGCGDLTVLGVPEDCAEQEIPVYPGAQSVYIRSTAQGPASDPFAFYNLRLEDNAGQWVYGTTDGPSRVIDLDDLRGYLNEEEPWLVDVSRSAAVLDDVELEVKVLYGAEAATAEAEAATAEASTPWAGHLQEEGASFL